MKQSSSSSSISMKSIFTLLAFIFFIIILYAKDFSYVFRKHPYHNTNFTNQRMSSLTANERTREKLPFAIGEADKWCDVFSGRWVHDCDQRPLYEESECPYIVPQLTCQQHGRPDKNYQHWRWQPHGCSLPSFNATLMLKSLQGKRMMFIGDSLNRNQYISMICLLQKVIPKDAQSMKAFGSLTIFTAKDYNATIEFYWAPFLLESNSDDAHIHRLSDRIVRKDSMNKHGKHWQGADILVFNTYLWWISVDESKILQGSFDDKVKEIKVVPLENAYRMAMNSFIKWINKNINPKKTRVFFISMSPTHEMSMEWRGSNNMNDGINGSCYNERSIIEDPTYWGSSTKKILMQVISEEFMKSKVPITFLNITQLSNYRKDAHTSIYKKQWKPLTAEQLANPVMYADCVHWCLPGLPDTWNELLFSNLLYPSYSF